VKKSKGWCEGIVCEAECKEANEHPWPRLTSMWRGQRRSLNRLYSLSLSLSSTRVVGVEREMRGDEKRVLHDLHPNGIGGGGDRPGL